MQSSKYKTNGRESSTTTSHLFHLNAARLALGSAIASSSFLGLLHLLSPEFHPVYRMISEYALGNHRWAIALMFFTWSLGSFALVAALSNDMKSIAAKFGALLLLLAGVGQLGGGIFGEPTDPRHGLAFALGVPTLPIAALLLSASLRRNAQFAPWRGRIQLAAHLPWISLVLMIAVILVGLANGGQFGEDILVGIPNRLLVIAYNAWVGIAAWSLVQVLHSNSQNFSQ